jgi:L-seryl-tRNA(Ser) seleniumtransferase
MTESDTRALLRSIPAMDDLLNAPWAAEYAGRLGRERVKTILAEALNDIRGDIRRGVPMSGTAGELAVSRAEALLREQSAATLKRAVNATGVVIHTNLGRAPLAEEALHAAGAIAGTYSTLEYSPETGGRGERNSHVERLLCRLTGAEAALAVNNNAAAVLLALSAIAAGREVIVSAGELVEIGASFRIPDILSFSGAVMRAVGCTNAARISDYRGAITENTAVLLKVHPSNYRIDGFVTAASRAELAALASSRGLVFMEDLGSGLLLPLDAPFAKDALPVSACLEAGPGIVTFSGDKLLGGPQIGVIAGAKALIDRMRGHQLLRALRVDKMTLAAFEATLRLYLSGRHGEIPVIRMIETGQSALLEKARALRRLLQRTAAKRGAEDFVISVVETDDAVGGGAFPGGLLPGAGVAVSSASVSAAALHSGLRAADIPVIALIRADRVILHVRTLLKGDEQLIAAAFSGLMGRGAIIKQ